MLARRSMLAVAVACTLTVGLTGCATTSVPTTTESGQTVTRQAKQCNPILIGLGAAAACALITKDAAWTAGCAALAVASCVAFNNYQVKQLKTEEQVVEEYIRHKGALPEAPVLVSYDTTLTPGQVVARGEPLNAVSTMSVVPSRHGGPILIEEEWTMYDAKGEKWLGPVRKKVNEVDQSAGSYQSAFTLTVPKQLPQGNYEFRSRVFVNGSEAQDSASASPIQIAALGTALDDIGVAGE